MRLLPVRCCERLGCHRTVGTVFDQWSRVALPPLLSDDYIDCFSDTVSRCVTEVCEEFYDTLNASYERTLAKLAIPVTRSDGGAVRALDR